jgi:hypothetical protein
MKYLARNQKENNVGRGTKLKAFRPSTHIMQRMPEDNITVFKNIFNLITDTLYA